MSEKKTFREIVGEAIGEASMCWSERPQGIFNSARASKIVDKIFDAFHLESSMGVTRWVDICKQNEDLQSRLDMAVECLKFYAAEENWEFTSDFHGHEYYEEIKLVDVESTSLAMSYGGKRAREVLKQINPKGG